MGFPPLIMKSPNPEREHFEIILSKANQVGFFYFYLLIRLWMTFTNRSTNERTISDVK